MVDKVDSVRTFEKVKQLCDLCDRSLRIPHVMISQIDSILCSCKILSSHLKEQPFVVFLGISLPNERYGVKYDD